MRQATIDLLRAAYGRYAVGAFNVCNMEQIHGLFQGASLAKAPVIAQFTRVMRSYAHPEMLEAMLRGAEAIYPDVGRVCRVRGRQMPAVGRCGKGEVRT